MPFRKERHFYFGCLCKGENYMKELAQSIEEREELLIEIVKVLRKRNRLMQAQEIKRLEGVAKIYNNDFLNKEVLMKKILLETEQDVEQKWFNDKNEETGEAEKMRKINVFGRLPKNVLDTIEDMDGFLRGEMTKNTVKQLENYYLNATVYDGRCFMRFLYC